MIYAIGGDQISSSTTISAGTGSKGADKNTGLTDGNHRNNCRIYAGYKW